MGSFTPVASHENPSARKLLSLVDTYTANFPKRSPSLQPPRKEGEVTLLTGTTGVFGCNILGRLSSDPLVTKIYALNRHSPGEGLVSRQMKALERRGVLEECLRSPKFQLVEADTSKANLGISPSLYDEIRDSITHIIDNAWEVNLIKPLKYFEGCLQGLRNLIDLALASPYIDPPKILFVSTCGMLRDYPGRDPAPEEAAPDPIVAIGLGYPESKWIAEWMLLSASRGTGLSTTIVRVGVLCGDRKGYWNTMDAVPIMVKSACSMSYVFDVKGDGLVSWLPPWEAADVLCTMRHTTEPILHLASPNPVPWNEIIRVGAKELGLKLIPLQSWIPLLQGTQNNANVSREEKLKHNPAILLLPFLQVADLLGDHKEPIGQTRLCAKKAVEVAPRLRDIRIDEEIMKKWITEWRKIGFLPPKAEGGDSTVLHDAVLCGSNGGHRRRQVG